MGAGRSSAKQFSFVIILIIIFMVGSRTSYAIEMQTIDKYISQNDFQKNPGASRFIFMRCASLYTLIGASFISNQETKQIAQKLIADGEKILDTLIKQNPLDKKYINDQAILMLEGYKERFLKAKALTGNFSDDPIIKADTQTCEFILKGK